MVGSVDRLPVDAAGRRHAADVEQHHLSNDGQQHRLRLDARTGEQKWMYDAKIDPITARHMCCGTHNRGLAISEGKLILAANDARLIALDAVSGEELWQGKVAEISEY